MPRLSLRIGIVTLFLAFTGCATTHTIPSSDIFKEAAEYKDQTVDIVDRAPQSMSLPKENGQAPVIDPLYMRTQADYHFTLAEAFSLESNHARAIEEYKLTLVYDPKSPVVRLRLAAEYIKQGLVSESMEQAKIAVENDPKYEDAHLLLGGLYSALRMYDEALAEYKLVLGLNPESTEAPMFIGALLAEQKKYGEAITYFESLTKNPKNRSTHLAFYYMGRIRLEEAKPGYQAKAEEAFKSALQAKPNFVDAALALGQLYESMNRRQEAVQHYRTYQDKYGPDMGVAEALSKLYMEVEDYQNAFRQYEVIEASDSDNLNVKVKMAFILIEQKKYPEAIMKLEEILARAPYSDKIRFYLGAVYEEIKDYPGAIAAFAKIPVGSTYYAEGVVHMAFLQKLLQDYPKAIETIQAGIKNQPEHAPFYALYASFLDETKDYKGAVEMLKGAVQKFPDNAQLHFFLGSMLDRIGQTESMIVSMIRVLEIDKDHVQALNYLAYTYAEQNRNLDEAERLVRRAVELQPQDGYILDTLGWVLFKKGNTNEAVQILEAAYKHQPKESIIAEHLGDAYYKHQLPEKAKKMYLRATEVETNVETLRKLRAKVVSIDQQVQSTTDSDPKRQPASAKSP